MAWRSEAAGDHSRVLAQCFAGAYDGPGAAAFTAQREEEIWQEASSWKGYCDELAVRAAANGHEGCLRVLHELGGEAAASLAAANGAGRTPAHYAASQGHEGCLRVLHELLCVTFEPQLAMLAQIANVAGAELFIHKLRAHRSLSWTQSTSLVHHMEPMDEEHPCAAALAARAGHVGCFRFLAEIGGAATFLTQLREWSVHLIDSKFPCLLTEPTLLDLDTKRGWLDEQLRRKVQAAGSDAAIELIVHRDDMLQGLCDALGVDETSGHVDAQARGVHVTFHGEAAVGDGLRREWFGATTKEITDPNRGLFISLDGGRTFQPSPESGAHAADHLAHFALLGRIAGMALHHREPLDVSWSAGFLKAVLAVTLSRSTTWR